MVVTVDKEGHETGLSFAIPTKVLWKVWPRPNVLWRLVNLALLGVLGVGLCVWGCVLFGWEAALLPATLAVLWLTLKVLNYLLPSPAFHRFDQGLVRVFDRRATTAVLGLFVGLGVYLVWHRTVLAGSIIDAESRQPLAGVTVSIPDGKMCDGQPAERTTDSAGHFGFEGLGGGFNLAQPIKVKAKKRGYQLAEREATPGTIPLTIELWPELITTKVTEIKLRLIPAGSSLMGSPDDDKDAYDVEKPQHEVGISGFYLGETEVTQAQYEAVMGKGKNPSSIVGQSTDRFPVESVSWRDAVDFCNKLSELEGKKPYYAIEGEAVRVPSRYGPGYRLPTEAEWEYACRAGTTTRYSFGDDENALGEYAWYSVNSGGQTHSVGGKKPNGFGLHDMHGNVWEWCQDVYDTKYDTSSPKRDPVNEPSSPAPAAYRVIRGGGWVNVPLFARSACRNSRKPEVQEYDLGFRLARVQSPR
jgi:formylglycine-generating enzyme required for sulfatase activity